MSLSFQGGNPAIDIISGRLRLVKLDHDDCSPRRKDLRVIGFRSNETSVANFCRSLSPLPQMGADVFLRIFRLEREAEVNEIGVCEDSLGGKGHGLAEGECRFEDRSFLCIGWTKDFGGLLASNPLPKGWGRAERVETISLKGFEELSCEAVLEKIFPTSIEEENCAVCLEKVVQRNVRQSPGLLVRVLCGHAFHGACLEGLAGNLCPVCRYPQSPCKPQRCHNCQQQDHLRVCLICGYVGCIRRRDRSSAAEDEEDSAPGFAGRNCHSYQHFLTSGHLFALEIETENVFDFVQNAYVHRLIQERNSLKLIQVDEPKNAKVFAHKFELSQITLKDLNATLNDQLISQTQVFDGKANSLKSQFALRTAAKQTNIQQLTNQFENLQGIEDQAISQSNLLDRNIRDLADQIASRKATISQCLQIKHQLQLEKEQHQAALDHTIQQLRTQQKQLLADQNELKAQLSDIQFHLRGRRKVKNRGEEGTLIIRDAQQ